MAMSIQTGWSIIRCTLLDLANCNIRDTNWQKWRYYEIGKTVHISLYGVLFITLAKVYRLILPPIIIKKFIRREVGKATF